MKFKNNLKRFFTMSRQTGGFTLVELIVVIAILAILAGVAIPAYSGYITKANEAADTQLLSAINRAFTAACTSNGFSQYDIADGAAVIYVNADGTVGRNGTYFSSVVRNGVNVTAKVNEAFATFYAGNETAAFKVYRNLSFQKGAFSASEAKSVSINGVTYYVTQEAIDNFKAAGAFSENVEVMQNQVGALANTYGGIVGGLSDEQVKEILGENSDAYLAYLNEKGATTGTAKGNATVLYIAQQSEGMTAQDAMNTLCNAAYYMQTNAGSNPSLVEMLEAAGSTGDTLSTAAMMYGAVTAYANNSNDPALKQQAANVNDGDSLMALFTTVSNDQGFLNYCGTYTADENGVTSSTPSAEFERDMNGYLGALSGMNSVSGGLDINDENLWTGDSVDQLLSDMLG